MKEKLKIKIINEWGKKSDIGYELLPKKIKDKVSLDDINLLICEIGSNDNNSIGLPEALEYKRKLENHLRSSPDFKIR